jgi:peroxiredoxin (alkyl hydroperoxide reductase subunit C)
LCFIPHFPSPHKKIYEFLRTIVLGYLIDKNYQIYVLIVEAYYPLCRYTLFNPPYGAKTMSLINTTIKSFKTTALHDGKFVPVSEANLKGQWSVVFFYPADFTFVCPTELGDLADHYDTFKALGVEIYSVSTDTHFAHKAWHDTSDTINKIRYPMLGDPTGAISRSFDVMVEESGLALRGTFVINPEGQIKIAEIHDDGIGRDAKELLRKVQAAQYVAAHPGQVCPAKWTPGAETLAPSLDLVGKI